MDESMDQFRRRMLAVSILGLPVLATRGHATETIEQPAQTDAASFINRAFDEKQNAIDAGDQGYGAIVVLENRIVGQAPSRVVTNADPTAHAEMEAIRDAATRLGRRNLAGCILYSSSHPCPMCEAAAYWAGIERMIWGRDGRDAGAPGLC